MWAMWCLPRGRRGRGAASSELSGAVARLHGAVAVVVLDRLPLTPNGKLDRRALPEPEAGAARTNAARTPSESALAGCLPSCLASNVSASTTTSSSLAATDRLDPAGEPGAACRLCHAARRVPASDPGGAGGRAGALVRAGRGDAEADQTPTCGRRAPATPIMRWLSERGGPVGAVQPVGAGPVARWFMREEHLAAGLRALMDRHDALRLRLMRAPGVGCRRLDASSIGRSR